MRTPDYFRGTPLLQSSQEDIRTRIRDDRQSDATQVYFRKYTLCILTVWQQNSGHRGTFVRKGTSFGAESRVRDRGGIVCACMRAFVEPFLQQPNFSFDSLLKSGATPPPPPNVCSECFLAIHQAGRTAVRPCRTRVGTWRSGGNFFAHTCRLSCKYLVSYNYTNFVGSSRLHQTAYLV